MSEWGFLASRRWAGYLALVIVFAIACCSFGFWQFDRRAQALAEIARIDANYDAAPVSLTDVVPDPAAFDIDDRWQVVSLRGEYLVDDEVVVRNRPNLGSSGFEVVTPFMLENGSIFMIDRGWIAQASNGRPGAYDAPPSGKVEVTARLKPGEGRIPGRTSSGNEFATIDLDELADRVGGGSYTSAYGIEIQSPEDAVSPPIALPKPERDEGPHLSYALQWFVFAIMGFVGLAWAANRERLGRAEEREDALEPAPGDERRYGAVRAPKQRGTRGGADADAEDNILDAH